MTELRKQIEKSVDPSRKAMMQRALGYAGIGVYAFAHKALKAERFDITKQFLVIYEILEPENSEHQYLNAVIAGRQGKGNEALLYLHRAAQLGFSDVSRIRSEVGFQAYMDKQISAHFYCSLKRVLKQHDLMRLSVIIPSAIT